eukprot:m.78989 g.78989  ORF g.78989 m.78989 type:complete len:85 (+) comp10768_c0_seq1:166-420(+)
MCQVYTDGEYRVVGFRHVHHHTRLGSPPKMYTMEVAIPTASCRVLLEAFVILQAFQRQSWVLLHETVDPDSTYNRTPRATVNKC